MNAQARQAVRIDTGCATVLLIYLLIGCAIYVAAYGEPEGFSLTLVVLAFFWPFALVWWSLFWIGAAMAVLLMFLGLRYIFEDLW